MSDILQLGGNTTQITVDDETPILTLEEQPVGLALDEMESAYRYELWKCLEKLDELSTKTGHIDEKVDDIIDTQTAHTAALNVIDGVVDAIKVQTDKIPTLATEANATANKNEIEGKIDVVDGVVDAIKVETDKIGSESDGASTNTLFGKIANLLSTWSTWISGAWATLVANVSSIKATVEAIIIPTDYAKELTAVFRHILLTNEDVDFPNKCMTADYTYYRTGRTFKDANNVDKYEWVTVGQDGLIKVGYTEVVDPDPATDFLYDELTWGGGSSTMHEIEETEHEYITLSNIATKTDITTLRTNLNTDFNPETLTESEVNTMWGYTTAAVDSDGYLTGANIDDDGYIMLRGVELTDDNYLKLK